MTREVLFTGFEPFGRRTDRNISAEVLPSIQQRHGELVQTYVLPVAHDIAAEQLSRIIEDIEPAAVVMFGVNAMSRQVRLERQAKNRRYSMITPDNNGRRAIGRLASDGPRRYQSTLPLEEIAEQLTAADIPTKLSRDAGTFICNESLYAALHTTARLQETSGKIIPTGFVHLGAGLREELAHEAAAIVADTMVAYAQQT